MTLSRRSAGSQVEQLGDLLADSLIALELASFQGMEVTWFASAAETEVRLRKACRNGVDKAQRSGQIRKQLSKSIELTLQPVQEQARTLFGQMLDAALDSMADELAVCKDAIPKRFEGIADRSVQAAAAHREKFQTSAMDGFRAELQPAARLLYEAANEQVRLNLHHDDGDVDLLLVRLLSPGQVSLDGSKSRGVWWPTLSRLQNVARGAGYSHLNAYRSVAMDAFNAETE